MRLKVSLFAAVAIAPLVTIALAQTPNRDDKLRDGPSIDFEIAAGVEYDDNISVSQIDVNTGADDFAAVIDADLDVGLPLGPRTELDLGYGFSQSLHFDFTDFDLQSHLVTADLSHDFTAFEVGAAGRLAYSRLGGDKFLTMTQFNPYVAKFLGDLLYIRAGYTLSDRNFAETAAIPPALPPPTRDAKNHAYGGDVYFFIDGVKSYVVAGYEREREKADSDPFDYRGDNFRVRFAQRFDIGGKDARLSLGFHHERRDYDNVTPAIAVARDDKRNRFQAELEMPIAGPAFARLEFEHGDYKSNLPSADYEQNLVSLRLGFNF